MTRKEAVRFTHLEDQAIDKYAAFCEGWNLCVEGFLTEIQETLDRERWR